MVHFLGCGYFSRPYFDQQVFRLSYFSPLFSGKFITLPFRLVFDTSNPNFHYLVVVMGRFCSGLAGTGAILLTYFLTRDVYDEKRAVLASVFLAFSLYHSHNSSFATTERLYILLSHALLTSAAAGVYASRSDILVCGDRDCPGVASGNKMTPERWRSSSSFVMYLYTAVVKPLRANGAEGHIHGEMAHEPILVWSRGHRHVFCHDTGNHFSI